MAKTKQDHLEYVIDRTAPFWTTQYYTKSGLPIELPIPQVGQRCIVTEKNEKYSTISTEYSKKNRDIRYAAIVTDVYREPRYGETVIVFDVVYAPGNNLFGRHEVYAGALIGNRAHPSKMIISKARDEDWQDILKSKYEELNVRKQCAISFMDFYFAYKSKSDEDEDDDDDDEEEDEKET